MSSPKGKLQSCVVDMLHDTSMRCFTLLSLMFAVGDRIFAPLTSWYPDGQACPYPEPELLWVEGQVRGSNRNAFDILWLLFRPLLTTNTRREVATLFRQECPENMRLVTREDYLQYELHEAADVVEDADDEIDGLLASSDSEADVADVGFDDLSEAGSASSDDDVGQDEDFLAGRGDIIERAEFTQQQSNQWNRRYQDLTPVQLFVKLFTRELIQLIVEKTNENLENEEQHIRYGEVLVYIGLLIGMVLQKLASEDAYWRSGTDGVVMFPNFGKFMSYRRFSFIRSNIKFALVENPADKLWKLRPAIQKLQQSFQKAMPFPGEFISIDEGMVPYKGRRAPCKRRMPNKPIKCGFKIFMAVDFKSKFLFDFEFDDGSITAQNAPAMGATAAYVMRHVDRLNSMERHIICVDNYYTSLPLARAVLASGHDLIGTMNFRRGLPACVKLATKRPSARRCPQGTVTFCHNPLERIHIYGWMDNSAVYILDTAYGPRMTEIYRRKGAAREMFHVPLACKAYNENMGGVDAYDYRR